MRFQHTDTIAEGVVETVATGYDPKHAPDDGQIEKEDDVSHFPVREGDSYDRRATCDCPICCNIESLTPNHDASEFSSIEVGHRVDITGIIKALLKRDCRFFTEPFWIICSCHESR